MDILLLIIIVFFLKMADNPTRKLRTRRPPPYLVGDVKIILPQNSDPELFGYARTNYTRDFVSPAQQLNSLAKILSKFINSANKQLLEKLNDSQHNQAALTKNRAQIADDEVKKTQTTNDGAKRKSNQKYEIKDNSQKGGKQIGGAKDQHHHEGTTGKEKSKNNQGNKKGSQFGKNLKQVDKNDYLMSTGYLNKLQELKQQHGIALNNINKMQVDPMIKALQQQQQILKNNPSFREKIPIQTSFQSKNSQGGEKFFRRSTYHIAIAYHIHLNNIKQSGKDLQAPMILDPTYQAKKLKGQYDQPGTGTRQ